MTSQRHNPQLWVRIFLIYLAFAGLVPFLSELRTLATWRVNSPYQNFELTWGLMHIAPALIGVGIALWYIRVESVFSTALVVILTLQILFPLLEYRREGFDSRLETGLTWTGYLLAMLVLAVPFIAGAIVLAHRRRLSG